MLKKSRYEQFIDSIIEEEGFLEHPKNIGDGVMTLGSGLTAKKWHDLYKKRGNKWSKKDNRIAVMEEIENARKRVKQHIKNFDKLPKDAQEVILDIEYNTGAVNPKSSPNFVKAINSGDTAEAARQMDWGNTDPTFGNGLRKRNQRRAEKFLNSFDGKITTINTDNGKKMIFPLPDWAKGEKRLPNTVVPKLPSQDFPLNPEDRTVPSLDSWNGANSPAYGGNTPRIKGIQEYMNDQQNELNRVLPGTLAIDNQPTASIFPSLDQLMSYGKELFVRDITGAPSIYDNALNNPTINKFLIPTLYANKGKDLPGYRGGNDLVLKYDKFVENDPYYIATALSYLPIIGTAMDIREAVKNPTAENIGYAALSGITDLVGGRLFNKVAGNIIKAKKTAKAVKKAELNHWRNTPYYLSMPKELAERTVKYYAQRAADEVLDAANITGEFIPEARLVPAASVYFPDFMANMSLHKHNKGKDLPKYAPGKDDEQVERGGITYNVHPSALTEKEMLNVEIPNTNVRSTPGMLRAREIRNENARIMAQRFLEQHPFGPNTPPVEPGLMLVHPEFDAIMLARAMAQYGANTLKNNDALLFSNNPLADWKKVTKSKKLLDKDLRKSIYKYDNPDIPGAYDPTRKKFMFGSINDDKVAEAVQDVSNFYNSEGYMDRLIKHLPDFAKKDAEAVKNAHLTNLGNLRVSSDMPYFIRKVGDSYYYRKPSGTLGLHLNGSVQTAVDLPLEVYYHELLHGALDPRNVQKIGDFVPGYSHITEFSNRPYFVNVSGGNNYVNDIVELEVPALATLVLANKFGIDINNPELLELYAKQSQMLNYLHLTNTYGSDAANRWLNNAVIYGSPMLLGIPPKIIADGVDNYNKGKDIYIKPSKRGTFTAAAKKRGKSVQEFASQVLANPGNYSPAMRKKALFARNSKKWSKR